jgi:hypothetical protein
VPVRPHLLTGTPVPHDPDRAAPTARGRRFTGPLIDKMLRATFTEMLAATEKAALANGGER